MSPWKASSAKFSNAQASSRDTELPFQDMNSRCWAICEMRVALVELRSALLVSVLVCLTCTSCVSKSKAQAQARTAFLAGQQQAAIMNQRAPFQGPTVTILGEVKNNIVPWTADLTLAKALLAANYYGSSDPTEILVQRGTQEIRYNSAKLLSGEDLQLQPNDVVILRH